MKKFTIDEFQTYLIDKAQFGVSLESAIEDLSEEALYMANHTSEPVIYFGSQPIKAPVGPMFERETYGVDDDYGPQMHNIVRCIGSSR